MKYSEEIFALIDEMMDTDSAVLMHDGPDDDEGEDEIEYVLC